MDCGTLAPPEPARPCTSESLPMVTVIMPIRNEAAFINRSLGAVLAQDYPPDRMEIIVADGISTDGTGAIVRTLQKDNANLCLIANAAGIVSTGLNAALAKARGEVIVRVDGHTIVEPDYVRRCVETLQRSKADNVGGRMNAVGESPFARAVALATSTPFGVGGARFHYSDREEWVDTVYMGAWSRTVFDKVGGFDEEMVRNQDDEFNYRLRSQGGRILLAPEIRSHYYNRATYGTLWKQYLQYGFWKVRVIQKHLNQTRARQFVPALFVGGLAAASGLALFSAFGKWILITAVVAYLTANLAASVLIARGSEKRQWALVSAAFCAMHLAYGLGFWMGLKKFWNRWGDKASRAERAPARVKESRTSA